jgi:ribosome-associated toxin RatA of RatAB toxin-antitoxin module
MLTTINRSALVMYPAAKMYALVNDVAAYPKYMDGCAGAEVLEHSELEMVARLDLKKGGIAHSFTTRNRLDAPHAIVMQLESGPFKRFEGEWAFKPLSEAACKVSLLLEFEGRGLATSIATSGLFSKVANNMVDAICKRAEVVYGKSIIF